MAEEEKPPVSEVKEPEVTEEKADSTEKKLEKLTVEEKQEDSAKFDPQSETKEDEEVREDEVLDDDEIEENPAYIPKKGKYYMHDSRDENGPGELDGKRSRADGAWSHDRYVDSWQQPKSKKQLVARYGFDIRYGETEEEASKNEQDVPKEIPSPSDERPVQRGRGRGRGSGAPRPFNQPREQYQRRSQEEHDSFEDDGEERGGSRRQRQTKLTVVRNVRGGRGQPMTNGRGSYRNQERPRGGGQRSGDVREDRREDMPPQKREDFMENHRRGAMRGAVQSRQFVRTVSSSNRFERGGRQSDSRQEMSDDRGGHEDRRPSRGITSRGRGRGGVRGASGGASEHRGSHGPSRTQDSQPRSGYTPRQEVVFFDHPAPSAASHQQSPVVYFDPASQQANRPLPPREKKIIEIKSPN